MREVFLECAMPRDLAAVAVGGYGRGQLYPHSDVDVLVLLPSGIAPPAGAIEHFFATLWDIGIELSHAEIRRQVLTTGIRLNDLVDKRFRVGGVEAVGIEWCEPCNHIQSLTYPGVLKGMVHRAGLRADIVQAGTISVGDEVDEVRDAAA